MTPLRRAAILACLAMASLLVALQFVLTPGAAAPTPLFLLFTLVWLFGAAMLGVAPRFGAAGTTAYGLISAFGVWRTHAVIDLENAVLLGGSLAAAGLAAGVLVAAVRESARGTV